MRLIDADAFIEQLKADIVEMHVPEFIVAAQALTIDIAERPTIEAIPVEWLKKHGAHLVTMPKRKFDSSNMAFLFTLIKDWEDENGTENN